MFSLFKRNKDNDRVPEWASFFSRNEYNEFLKSIESYFKKKNINYELNDGVLTTDSNVFGGEDFGLMNVAQICKQSELRNYKGILFEHFESMIRSQEFQTRFNVIVHDYNLIKDYIGVRLYSNDYITNIGKELTIGKDLAGDIYCMIVFDLPDSVINIQPEQASKWGKTIGDLFETGIKNMKNKYQWEISQQKFSDFNIWLIQGDHFFTPNIVFDLNNHKRMIGTHGSLIGIPHRHSVIIYPIENIDVVKAINILIPTIYGMNEEGPGSVSNNLFWYKEGNFENLPYKIENQKLDFYPPGNFVEMLNRLSK